MQLPLLALAAVALTLLLVPAQAAARATATQGAVAAAAGGDRAITQVVKLLQDLLEKSQKEGDTERDLYSKYKCYCDTNEASKKAEIEKLTEDIGLLESKIDELQASSAVLSKEVAQLDKDMAANNASQAEATQIRGAENQAFLAKEADLTTAIDQMKQAIEVLSEVGADQTVSTGADHTQYMAGYKASLPQLRSTVKQALLAASAFVSKTQSRSLEAFLQAPFTGTYTAQSGEVVGILKDMRDTFKANLAEARATEAKALAAYNSFMATMGEAYDAMKTSFDTKQGILSANDQDLATKKAQLSTAQQQRDEAQDFLAKLLEMCAAKKKQYDERVALRANEQAALSEAISILNSDAAFETFGTVNATSTGPVALVQLRAIRRHRPPAAPGAASPRQRAQAFLQRVAGSRKAPLLNRILALLQANNPFAVVLSEIEKMKELIAAEERADIEQKTWCDKERSDTTKEIGVKEGQITTLTGEIGTLTTAIEDPTTGLLAMIKASEESLQANYENQVSQTQDRKEENVDYQKNIANLVEAEALLERAITVLKKYYSKITASIQVGLLQGRAGREDPAPPATWEDKYKGQSEAGGTDAISMLEFILQNTKSEEAAAHTAEATAQHDYEESMDSLKTEEKNLQQTLAKDKETLAETQKQLMEKTKELAATKQEKEALEAYLEKIKPGCDFITTNIDLRMANRAEEKAALETAATLLKGTPAYQEALAAAHNESLGDCLAICSAQTEAHVDCKACLAKTSVPGYCAGHPSTLGC